MNRRILSALAAAAVILPLGAFAFATQVESAPVGFERIAQRPMGAGERHGAHHERLLQELDLSDEQSEQIKAIYAESREDKESKYEQLREAREEMRSLLASNATPEQLRQQHRQMQSLHQQLGNQRFETMLEVREVLTPEQRSQMAELMMQHRGRHGHRFAQ